MKHGKKYLEALKQVDRTKQYTFNEAVELVKKVAFAKFDETVEMSLNLSLKKSQSVRDTVVLPNQFSAEKRVLVFAKGDKAQEALDAGATYVGDVDLVEKIRGGCDSRHDEGCWSSWTYPRTTRSHAEPEDTDGYLRYQGCSC
jgi:large subunit ribosomal protein L1